MTCTIQNDALHFLEYAQLSCLVTLASFAIKKLMDDPLAVCGFSNNMCEGTVIAPEPRYDCACGRAK